MNSYSLYESLTQHLASLDNIPDEKYRKRLFQFQNAVDEQLAQGSTDKILRAAELELLTATGKELHDNIIEKQAQELLMEVATGTESYFDNLVTASAYYCLGAIHFEDEDEQYNEKYHYLEQAVLAYPKHWNAAIAFEEVAERFSEKAWNLSKRYLKKCEREADHYLIKRRYRTHIAENLYCANKYDKAVELWEKAELVAPIKDHIKAECFAISYGFLNKFKECVDKLEDAYHLGKIEEYSLPTSHFNVEHPIVWTIAREVVHLYGNDLEKPENLTILYFAFTILPADYNEEIAQHIRGLLYLLTDNMPEFDSDEVDETALRLLNGKLLENGVKEFVYDEPANYKYTEGIGFERKKYPHKQLLISYANGDMSLEEYKAKSDEV